MPYVYTEPSEFLEYNGVTVFHVYDGDEPWKYWYTTDPSTADECRGHGDGGHFDARRFVGQWPETPTVAQWENWWRPRFNAEDEAIKALIRTAVDAGFLAINR